MEIEKLRLILETLQGVGQEAGGLAALYLWLQFGSSVITSLSFVAVFLVIGYGAYRGIMLGQDFESRDQFLREMRDYLGTGTRGTLTSEEANRTMASLRRLVTKEKA
jgi:hypothetical protein